MQKANGLTTQERQEVEQELAELREDLAGEGVPLDNPRAREARRLFQEATRQSIERLEGMLAE